MARKSKFYLFTPRAGKGKPERLEIRPFEPSGYQLYRHGALAYAGIVYTLSGIGERLEALARMGTVEEIELPKKKRKPKPRKPRGY